MSILALATRGQTRRRAQALLEKLLADTDDIIPVTVFDQVETWTEGRGALLDQLADVAIGRGGPTDLVRRAERAKNRIAAQARG